MLQGRCVQALHELRSLEMIRREKGGLSLLLPGSLGVQVHSAGSDEKKLQQLRLKTAKLELQVGVPLGKFRRRAVCIEEQMHPGHLPPFDWPGWKSCVRAVPGSSPILFALLWSQASAGTPRRSSTPWRCMRLPAMYAA